MKRNTAVWLAWLLAGLPALVWTAQAATNEKEVEEDQSLASQLVTPHKPWAKGYSKGAPRALFIVTPGNYDGSWFAPETRADIARLHGLLVVEDKLSMAHSLETRVPFLDNDLVDFAMRVPVRCKLANLAEVVKLNENEPGNKAAKYFQKTRDGKLLLRKVMERHIPRQITEQTKQGFSAPDASWFKGESIEYVKRRLFSPRARLYEYLDRQAVHGIIDDHLSGRRNRRLAIWSLLYVEEWLQRFLS